MSSGEFQQSEAEQRVLLARLQAAEEHLHAALHTRGFGSTAQAHMERARAHIAEAFIAIKEPKAVRSVQQLVDDLIRVEQVVESVRRGKSHRI